MDPQGPESKRVDSKPKGDWRKRSFPKVATRSQWSFTTSSSSNANSSEQRRIMALDHQPVLQIGGWCRALELNPLPLQYHNMDRVLECSSSRLQSFRLHFGIEISASGSKTAADSHSAELEYQVWIASSHVRVQASVSSQQCRVRFNFLCLWSITFVHQELNSNNSTLTISTTKANCRLK